jgi:hypothetical protein
MAPLEHAVQYSSLYFQQIMLNTRILGRTMKLKSMSISELGLNLFRLWWNSGIIRAHGEVSGYKFQPSMSNSLWQNWEKVIVRMWIRVLVFPSFLLKYSTYHYQIQNWRLMLGSLMVTGTAAYWKEFKASIT